MSRQFSKQTVLITWILLQKFEDEILGLKRILNLLDVSMRRESDDFSFHNFNSFCFGMRWWQRCLSSSSFLSRILHSAIFDLRLVNSK